MSNSLSCAELNSILADCRQCGICCKTYRKVVLQPSEVQFISKMGGHVGTLVPLNKFRKHSLRELVELAHTGDKVFMIHPDGRGCIFLEKRNNKYFCKIYHYRPMACRGFRCNLADSTLLDMFADNAICLISENCS